MSYTPSKDGARRLLEIVEERTRLRSPSCTMDSVFYGRLEEVLFDELKATIGQGAPDAAHEFALEFPGIARKLGLSG